MNNLNKKAARKKLKEKAKTAKRNSGRRPIMPANKVIPDAKKELNKTETRKNIWNNSIKDLINTENEDLD